MDKEIIKLVSITKTMKINTQYFTDISELEKAIHELIEDEDIRFFSVEKVKK